ncbi:sporulation integral membrane protein YlbJ [Scopulibacillus daqui]|uniref:Sporulation integral membrane protein YlbJ n=1 Tax=Scopulibacillus daqui TaxID=1469162 RepID=A0ABS2PWA0_9BACL|nr:sporulation integral membrane protein YlbJ [Scopulibacillus daqui]MBM7644243.1 sporulation integral membrane protein YlbJ [Scopulibacillus daqui]
MSSAKLKTIILAITALFLAVSIIAFPKVSVDASLNGLKLWWNVVFPSLLPFFIVSELMIGFGIVTFIGVLLEPIMRPIFKVPGAGAFVFVMGLASGFPAGAKITSRLYEEKKLTKTEAERLASFTNFSNPLFIFGVVAYGFFHQAALGIVFALSHYLGNICVGLIMRFYRPNERSLSEKERATPAIFIKALKHMHRERIRNKQPLGKMLGDAVQTSVSTLLMVGGFIILFSVLNQLFARLHITDSIAYVIKHLLLLLHFSPDLSKGIVPGLFEITVGAKNISSLQAPLLQQVIVACFILGFAGFSIQAQVASILADAKLSAKPFFIGRLIHGTASACAAFVLFQYVDIKQSSFQVNAVVESLENHILPENWTSYLQIGSSVTLITLIIYILTKAYANMKKI